jgi:hypothetical protein
MPSQVRKLRECIFCGQEVLQPCTEAEARECGNVMEDMRARSRAIRGLDDNDALPLHMKTGEFDD